MSDNVAIDIQDLQFSYGNQKNVIEISQWSIPSNSQTFLYGPSGSGKSTLLNLLSGMLSPNHGKIVLLGQSFSQMSSRRRDAFRAQHIGVVFQEFNLIPFLSVIENIELAVSFVKNKPVNGEGFPALDKNIQARSAEIFDRLKLDSQLLTKRSDQLSVGQRQRVSIARALINRPEILIADEPTSALDSDNRDEFMRLLMDTAAASNCTVLFVSHDLSLKQHFSRSTSINELSLSL